MSIFIVGGGPSINVDDLKIIKNRRKIAVNGSILHLEKPEYFITVDYTFYEKLRNKKYVFDNAKRTTKIFVANFANSELEEYNGRIRIRKNESIYDLKSYNMIIKSYKVRGMGYSFGDFRNGINSGFCALQFAVIMGYDPIYLLGIDLKMVEGKAHYHNIYRENKKKIEKKRLEKYFSIWKEGIRKIKKRNIRVYSCSEISKLNSIIEYRDIRKI